MLTSKKNKNSIIHVITVYLKIFLNRNGGIYGDKI